MTVRKLCDRGLGLYRSAGYPERRERLTPAQDLWRHEAIILRAGSGQLRPWTVHDAGRTSDMAPNVRIIVSDGR
jgi:hypothetical protein